MSSKVPESTRLAYARQLADEAKTLVPSMERLGEIAAELRADDLFRLLGFDTWERFCTDYLGVSKWTANRWIAGPKQKSIGAGQKVAAVQNAPIVESNTLKVPATSTEAPAKPSEGGGQDGETRPAPTNPSPSGTVRQRGENPGGDPVFPGRGRSDSASGASAPLPPADEPVRPPSDRALTARVFAAMREVDPTDAGPVTTPEEATFLRQWAQRTLDAWRAKNGIERDLVSDKPQRRQGTITRPQAAVLAGRAVTRPVLIPTVPAKPKRHADDCSCLSCVPPKVAAK